MKTREKINKLTNPTLDKEIKGIIATKPCECGGKIIRHFRYRGEWSGYFWRCTQCGKSEGVV